MIMIIMIIIVLISIVIIIIVTNPRKPQAADVVLLNGLDELEERLGQRSPGGTTCLTLLV